MEAVAARAATSTPVLYRRWPDRTALPRETLVPMAMEAIPYADTGSSRSDKTGLLWIRFSVTRRASHRGGPPHRSPKREPFGSSTSSDGSRAWTRQAPEGVPMCSLSRAATGVTTLMGRPNCSTRRGKSRRSHCEVRFGSVEINSSSKWCSRRASPMASRGSGPPERPWTGARAARSRSGSARSSVQSALFGSAASGMRSANRHDPA